MFHEMKPGRISRCLNVNGRDRLPLTPCLRAAYVPLTFPLTSSSQEGLYRQKLKSLDLDYVLNFYTLERL